MPIKQTTPQAAIKASLDAVLENARTEVLEELTAIGLEAVNEARRYNGKAYEDQTGNLRSSTGFVIVEDGHVISLQGFEQVPARNDPKHEAGKGSPTGREYAQNLAAEFPDGITLIVVAGMHYAAYVAAKGYNVLDSSELYAKKAVRELIEELFR